LLSKLLKTLKTSLNLLQGYYVDLQKWLISHEDSYLSHALDE